MPDLAEIFGQPRAIETISRAIASSRLPHGMIFSGAAGVGKATTARALGRLFLCERPPQPSTYSHESLPRACGSCPSCVVFDAGNHPDFHVIYRQLIRLEKSESKARDLSADVIRTHLVGPAMHTSQMGVGKVFVVEEAELMNASAQNSMLKTLEEPPGRCLIVLLTDMLGALLPTIRSRCQVVRFGALAPEIVARELASRGVSPRDSADATRLTGGSLGVALRWSQDGVIDAARELESRLTDVVAGRGATDLPDWFKKSGEAYAAKQLERDELASKDQATKEGLGVYLKLAGQFFQTQLKYTDDPDTLEAFCSAIDALARSETYLDSNVTVSVLLQQLSGTFETQFARV